MSHLVYRVIFSNQEQVYTLYAKYLAESEMYGFLEIQDLVLDLSKSYQAEQIMVDNPELSSLPLDESAVISETQTPLSPSVSEQVTSSQAQALLNGTACANDLKHVFKDVKRVYIPCHAVIRIDELTFDLPEKSKIRSLKEAYQAKLSHLKNVQTDR